MHELLSTPLGRRLGTAAAGGTVLALGVYFGQVRFLPRIMPCVVRLLLI